MSAIEFFQSQDVKLKSFKEFRPKRVITETHRLNYSIITLVTREVSDSLWVYARREYISSNDVAYFEKLANGDNDNLFSLYEKHGFLKEASDDFQRVVSLFRTLAKRSLSPYEDSSDPLLADFLSVIYGIVYLQMAVPEICYAIGRIPQANTLRILREKREELERVFNARLAMISNRKELNFNQFDNIFRKLLKYNRREFIEFTDQFNV